eukprot:1653940-Pleurochrysis_carterae.AAC.7
MRSLGGLSAAPPPRAPRGPTLGLGLHAHLAVCSIAARARTGGRHKPAVAFLALVPPQRRSTLRREASRLKQSGAGVTEVRESAGWVGGLPM